MGAFRAFFFFFFWGGGAAFGLLHIKYGCVWAFHLAVFGVCVCTSHSLCSRHLSHPKPEGPRLRPKPQRVGFGLRFQCLGLRAAGVFLFF